jgi:putative restriction endonuclease
MWPRRAPAGRERQRTVAAERPASLSRVTPINGLALCKLHHAAFDAYIIGVTPDLEVTVRLDVLQEIDGPMLQHGLQGFQGRRIHVPRADHLKPNRDFLAERYALFRRAS